MSTRRTLAFLTLWGLLAAGVVAPAHATVVCSGCEYDESGAGSYLGVHSGPTFDVSTFSHTGVVPPGKPAGRFEDFWVFDVTPNVVASMSATFTLLSPIFGFFGELYADDGSVCPTFSCTSVSLGDRLARVVAGGTQGFTIDEGLLGFLPEGRYILRIGGTANALNEGAYTGQLAVFGFAVREAGSLSLFLLALPLLFIAGMVHRGKSHR
jgi:hypothetical protein